MINKRTIDQVYEASRVEEVIGDYISLKKSGANFKGLSPFTKENTPSFMVSPVKQIWKDFSSGKGGNVVAFLMEHEHFTYPEAIRYLAKKYSIEIEETRQTIWIFFKIIRDFNCFMGWNHYASRVNVFIIQCIKRSFIDRFRQA